LAAAIDTACHFHLGVFRFTLRAETEAHLPQYKGSALRGAFGGTLKRVVCIRRDLDCEACLVRPSCIYTHIFETIPPEGIAAFHGQKYAPHPYVLEPPLEEKQRYAPGEPLKFGLTLIGRANDYLPYVIFAFDQAGRRGLGQGRGRFTLESVARRSDDGAEHPIYDGAEQRMATGEFGLDTGELVGSRLAQLGESGELSGKLKLRFLTPVRVRVDGDLQGGVSFELLMRSLLRRLWQLSLVHGEGEFTLDHRVLIERAKAVKLVRSELRWLDWERYSHRQKTKMKLGGLVGEVEYEFAEGADVDDFLPLLVLGEVLHVGTGTTFGLGKYEVVGVGS
jgi:hypothetical protein